MDLLSLAKLGASLVPVAKQIIDAIRGAQAEPSQSQEILDYIAKLSPVAASLTILIRDIREQTIEQHPAVWAAVREDYAPGSAEFDRLYAAAKKPK